MARKTRKNGDIAVQVLRVFAEHGEETLTTQEISETTGIHKSSVSRCLKRLSETMQIEKIKAGHYRRSIPVSRTELERPRTMADNEETINRLLSLYDRIQAVFGPAALMAFEQGRHTQAIQMMKNLTFSMDRLIHRWNLIVKGYDQNAEQARQDVKLKRQVDPPREEEPQKVGHWDMEKKKMIK